VIETGEAHMLYFGIGDADMPLVRDYPRGKTSKEAKFVVTPRESSIEIALHESVHAVILRLYGRDIAEVVDQDDRTLTILVEPQKYNVAALMAPEIYMSLNSVAFTDYSVSNDRDAVADCFRPEDVEDIRKNNWKLLVDMFQCPHLLAAISVLSARMDVELRKHGAMSGVLIHEIIDPILIHSPYADDLRERLNG
jgi:hypothetical protein